MLTYLLYNSASTGTGCDHETIFTYGRFVDEVSHGGCGDGGYYYYP